MRSKKGDDDGGALDSLLDTMTNVVGILIIVLVVTQLGVGDAVKRITDKIKFDPEKFAKDQQDLEALEKERDTLLAAKVESEPIDTANEEKQLEELLRRIAEMEKERDQLEQAQKDEEARLASAKLRAAAAKKKVDENEKRKQEREKLKGELSTAAKEIARLEAMLDDTPMPEAPPPKVVTLPNPRSAPKDAKQLTFICTQGKVYPLPPAPALEQIRKQSQLRAVTVAREQYRTFNPKTGEGTDRFLLEFNKQPFRNEYWDAKLANYSSSPRLVFEPKENGGETERIITGANSRFQRGLRGINPNQFFIRFYVCSDSYDIYVTTRRIVTDMGLLAGWEPQSNG